ncbi:hypothetical protein ACN6K9_007896 [Streptomyces sp. SAS_267]|uniref:hypothetical protein n=1 Tax=Streptomyces sp. SAS_267 TaxID=3412750 RepID=UPI00403D2DB0
MSRLSREQKRELKRQRSAAGAGGQPTAGTAPIEVHVTASADAAVAPGAAGVQGCATVGGMPVVAAPGETVQGAILNYLHRLALATGHPVLASIHDERIGFVVPLQVHVDGSSRYTAEPVRVAPPAPPVRGSESRPDRRPQLPPQEHRHTPSEGHPHAPAHDFTEPSPRQPQPPVREQHAQPPAPERRPQSPAPERPPFGAGGHQQPPAPERPRHPVGEVPQTPFQGRPQSPAEGVPQAPAQRRPEVPTPPLPPVPMPAETPVHASEAPDAPEAPAVPRRDKATFLLRAVPEPPARPIPGPESGTPSAPATTPEPVPAPAYPPTAPPARPEFVGESRPAPVRGQEPAVTAEFVPQPAAEPAPRPEFVGESRPAPMRPQEPAVTAEFVPQPQLQPQPVQPASPESVPAPAPAPVPAPAAMAEPVVTAGPGAGAGPANGGAVAPAPGPDQVPAADPAVPGTPTPSTFVLRAVPEPKPLPGAASTRVLRAVPESAAAAVPAPTGEFGPAPEPERVPEPKAAAPERKPASAMEALALLGPEPEPDPKPTPARGFDAVAEAVLAPSPREPAAERDAASAFLAEPVARINEAVKMGRIEAAAGMAERAVAEAAQALGQEHPEVLKLRELTAYIAYLAGDALRSFHLSLDLARVRRRHRDSGAAYGNVQSAAAAWRAVRDPLQGLHLGRDLIGLWTELAADDGPAADDLEQLESARTRMVRLAERARLAADNPYARTPRAHGE